jgi:hypothetical protein
MGRFSKEAAPFLFSGVTMADETIALQPAQQAAQVEQKPGTLPQAPATKPVVKPVPVIAVSDSHTDQAKKDMYDDGMATPYYPLYGVTSFADLDDLQQAAESGKAVQELTSQFQMIVGNVMNDPGVMDKSMAIRSLTNEFINRLRMSRSKEKTGFMQVVRSLFNKKQAVTDNDLPADLPEVQATKSSFMVWKEANGQHRWLAIYSNQFRDQDNPPEIISEKSHKSFLDLVDSGDVPYPELWHWHIPGTRWGQADWLDYADGFALASGTVDAGHEKEAESLAQMGDIRVSHGMPIQFIVRSKEDASVIDFHITAEISDLPGYAAANPLTEFVVVKEFDMALSTDKRQYLAAAGLSDDAIQAIEAGLAGKAQAAKDAGLDKKEAAAEAPVAEETKPPAYATQQEVAEGFAAVFAPINAALTAINAQLAAITSEVKALKESDATKIAEKAAATPRASLDALIAQSILGMDAAQIDGRSSLAKAGPKQADAAPASITGHSYIDQMIARSRAEVAQ